MKNKWSADKVRLVQQWLISRWPALFTEGPDLMPLTLDIHKEILKYREENPDLSRRVLEEALHRHASSFGYLYGMCKNTHRYNLAGEPVQEISPLHRQYARETLRQKQKLGRRKVLNGNVAAPKRAGAASRSNSLNGSGGIKRKPARTPVVVYKGARRRAVARQNRELSLAS